MTYKFKKTVTNFPNNKMKSLVEFGVDDSMINENNACLRYLEWWGWTPKEAQMIIDKSKALKGEERFIYEVEGSDLTIHVFPDEVYFFDYRTEQETEDLLWTFDQFIDFMEQFKKFIEENSK